MFSPITIKSMACNLWNYFFPSTHLEMASESANDNTHISTSNMAASNSVSDVPDREVEAAKPIQDGIGQLKVRKTRDSRARYPATERRSKSVATPSRYRAGKGFIDLTGVEDDNEARRVIDDHWDPPELPFAVPRTKSAVYPTPPPELQTGEEPEEQTPPRRRHSDDSQDTLRTPISSFSSSDRYPLHRTLQSNFSRPRSPLTPESKGNDLEGRLQGLLLDEEDTRDPYWRPSATKAIERRRKQEEAERRKQERLARERKERRLKRQNPLKPLIEPLDSVWEQKVLQMQSIRDASVQITTGLEGTPLARKDFETLLAPRAWLNDEIINAYLEWVVAAANLTAAKEAERYGEPKSLTPKFIAQNSFFYEKLAKDGPKSLERLMKRKKAPGASFMEVDSMFIPICRGSHWTMGVVRPVAKTIEYFDSMGGANRIFVDLVRSWLKFQLGKLYKEEEWTVPNTGCAHQSNSWDCGVFVCTNTFCVATGLDTACYHERDMKQQRRNIAAILMNRGFVGDFDWGKAGLLPWA